MDRKHEEYSEFKKEFWEWFDELPWHKKYMFWYYYEDMAETFYYFKIYSKKSLDSK